MRFIDTKDREITPEVLNETLDLFLSTSPSTKNPIPNPPKNLGEFEDRIGVFFYDIQCLLFGISYDVSPGATLKRDTNPERMVEVLLSWEKYGQKNQYLPQMQLETYQFLKLALEKDASLLGRDQYLLGLTRDRSGITTPQKNAISVQCTATILWFLEEEKIPTIEAMIGQLLDKEGPFLWLLELQRFSNQRTLRDWISEVFPLPKEERKKQLSKDFKAFNGIIIPPGIFTEKGVNFPRLRFALIVIARILKHLGLEFDQILKSDFIALLAEPIQFYPKLYIRDWIEEGYSSNSSIFTL